MIVLIFTSMLVTVVLCIALIPWARKIGLVDHPGRRKVHEESTPLTGGPALIVTSGLMLLFLASGDLFVQGLAMGGLLMFAMGLIDDLRPLSATVRFLVQIAACLIMVAYANTQLDDFGRLFRDTVVTLGWLSIPITVFAAMGVINSFNMIDGMDGVAGTLFLIAAAGMAVMAALSMQVRMHLLLLVAFSAVFGYLMLNARLPWNTRARVFMGDSGSMFLGFFLAWAFIALGNDHNEVGERAFMPITAVWLFAVPLLDTANNIWRRWRAGESAFAADQHHLHHAFLRAGFTVGNTWLMISGLALGLAAIGLGFELSGTPDYVSFWAFMAVAFSYHFYIRRSWSRQQFLRRNFIYNEFDE